MKCRLVAAVAMVILYATGCANTSPNVYSRQETMRVAEVREGIVVGVRSVTIAGNEAPLVGAGVGAVVGGLAGNALSNGRGAGTVLGVLAGGLGGAAIEHQATQQQGAEITVQLNSGSTVAVIQQAGQDIRVGDRVRLVSEDGRTRVQRV
jgi:outer membrane lipoprotein SlyB